MRSSVRWTLRHLTPSFSYVIQITMHFHGQRMRRLVAVGLLGAWLEGRQPRAEPLDAEDKPRL